MSTFSLRRLAWSLLVLMTSAMSAFSQMTYNVSVYTDISFDDAITTAYAVSTTSDNSTGCSAHGQWATTVQIIGPNGPSATATTSGMVSNTSTGLTTYGTYTAQGTASFYCGCFAHYVGAGGSSKWLAFGSAMTSYKYSSGGCNYYKNCEESFNWCGPYQYYTSRVNDRGVCWKYVATFWVFVKAGNYKRSAQIRDPAGNWEVGSEENIACDGPLP